MSVEFDVAGGQCAATVGAALGGALHVGTGARCVGAAFVPPRLFAP